jgi:hypothetical protein
MRQGGHPEPRREPQTLLEVAADDWFAHWAQALCLYAFARGSAETGNVIDESSRMLLDEVT